MTDLIGRKLGKYVLEERLGAGGMAAVFRSRHPQFDKPVAIKILPPTVSQDATFQARFEREGRTIAGLNHPHIIRVYDVDDADGVFYMVMDLLPGGTLEGRIREGELDRRWSVETIIKVAEALEYAHGQGVIHRDIKPSNILLDAQNQPVLADFGIARLMDPSETQLTSAGTVVGTPAYMAPEQLNGQPSDGRADIYSLGVVLYQLLVGRVPFTGDTMAVVSGHLTKEPPPLHDFAPDIPQTMEDVVLQALAKNPDHRFRSARVFAQALRNTLAELEPGLVEVASAARNQTPPSFGGVQLPTATRPEAAMPVSNTTIATAPAQPPPSTLESYARRYWPHALAALVVLIVLERIGRMRVGDLIGLIIFAGIAWFAYSAWRARNQPRQPAATASTLAGAPAPTPPPPLAKSVPPVAAPPTAVLLPEPVAAIIPELPPTVIDAVPPLEPTLVGNSSAPVDAPPPAIDTAPPLEPTLVASSAALLEPTLVSAVLPETPQSADDTSPGQTATDQAANDSAQSPPPSSPGNHKEQEQ